MRHLLLLLCCLSLSAQATITAQLDRLTVTEGESLLMTIEADQRSRQRPDLRLLQQDFRILGSKQMSISSHSKGESRFSTRWRIMLRPLRAGSLQLPALPVGNEYTPSFMVTVLANNLTVPGLQKQSQFIETELDTNELYINSQALLKVRLLYQGPESASDKLSDPLSEEALIRTLSDEKRYDTQVKGQTYHVIERHYGIFPKYSGNLVIEPVRFSSGAPGTETVTSEAIELAVLPQAFQKRPGYWVPSSRVELSDNLESVTAAREGEAIKRHVTLTAWGIPAAELPALSQLKNELAEIRLDNVRLDEKVTPEGIISTRTEELTLIPLERGEITLAAIEIPWWNVTQDKGSTATLGPRRLQVESTSTVASTAEVTVKPILQPQLSTETAAEPLPDSNLLIWLLTAIAVAATLGWWYSFARLRSQKDDQYEVIEEEIDIADLPQVYDEQHRAEQRAFQLLCEACDNNEPEIAKLRLIEWAQKLWPDASIFNCETLCTTAANQTLDFLILDLEHHIYHNETEQWRGDLLIDAASRLRDRQLRSEEMAEEA
ncbi:BatD family protein [Marinobacterium jannaschii]|uniref:BatD family protein n=1 Tax=Marinobacterium jannaschii TaxID=64970 RepID=UPI001471FB7E|nr:BatD family protein [Marinobacterium jannaschii]